MIRVIAAITIATTMSACEPLPEVWVGDLTRTCIVLVDQHGEHPCPEVLPRKYTEIIVFEENVNDLL